VTQLIDNAQDRTVLLDLSSVSGVTSAVLPAAAFTQFATAQLYVELALPQGSLTISPAIAQNIAALAGTGNVTASLQSVSPAGLTSAQRDSVKAGDTVFSISITAGTQTVRELGGILTVTVPYDGALPAAVWYLDAAGELHGLPSSFDEETGTVSFTTHHLSLFVIGQGLVTQIRLAIGSVSYTVNGRTLMMDVAPQIVNDRTMVPLRFIAEALGAKVDWDYDHGTETATIELDGQTLSVKIGVLAPGMDVPPMIINDRTMVPLRYISETLGCEVEWDPEAQTIDIAR
jgi:hypothetical protein